MDSLAPSLLILVTALFRCELEKTGEVVRDAIYLAVTFYIILHPSFLAYQLPTIEQ